MISFLGEVSGILAHQITESTWLKGKLLPTEYYLIKKLIGLTMMGKSKSGKV